MIRYPTTKHSVRYSKVKFVLQRETGIYILPAPREQRSGLWIPGIYYTWRNCFSSFCNRRKFRCRTRIYRRDIIDISPCTKFITSKNNSRIFCLLFYSPFLSSNGGVYYFVRNFALSRSNFISGRN